MISSIAIRYRAKDISARENPRACLQVDVVESDVEWESVLAFGDYEEVTNPNERCKILNKFLQRFPMLTPVESAIFDDAVPHSVIVFGIRVNPLSGVAEK